MSTSRFIGTCLGRFAQGLLQHGHAARTAAVRSSRLSCVLLLAVAVFGFAGNVHGAITTWSNATTDGQWGTVGNWDNGAPVNPVSEIFDATYFTTPQSVTVTGTQGPTGNLGFGTINDVPATVPAFTFTDGGSGLLSLSSGTGFYNTSDAANVMTFNVNITQTATAKILPTGGGFTFGSGFTYTTAGSLTIQNDASNTLQPAGDKPVLFNGTIAGPSGGSIAITATNANVTFAGNNSYSGVTTVNSTGGRLHITNNGALGATSGNTVISGSTSTGALVLDGGAGGLTIAEPFNLTPRSGAGLGTSQIISASGNNALTAASFSNIGGANAQSVTIESAGTGASDFLTVNSNIAHSSGPGQVPLLELVGAGNGKFAGNITASSGNFQLVKAGAGTWEVSGANNIDDSYFIHGGTLNLTGSNLGVTYTVDSGATLLVNGTNDNDTGSGSTYNVSGTLGGSGSIASSRADSSVNILAGGFLSPGNSPGTLTMALGTTGILDVSAAVAGVATHSMLFDLGTASDLVNMTSGTLSIGAGTMQFDDFTFTPGAGFGPGTYVLFQTPGAISGALASSGLSGLVGGFTGTLAIVGNNLDLIVTPVPEPSSFLLAGLGMAAVVSMARARRRA